MPLFTLTRNQAFPDLNGRVGDDVEVDNPEDEGWKWAIDQGVLVAKKTAAAKPAATAPADPPPADPPTPPADDSPDATLAKALGETPPAGGKSKPQ